MPLYEFVCMKCSEKFEEICKDGSCAIFCPVCGNKAERIMSLTGPLKKGAFPFKPLPPRPMAASRTPSPCAGSCPHNGNCSQ